MTEISDEDLKALIAKERLEAALESAKGQVFLWNCRQWFAFSLSNSSYLLQKGECLQETHNAGMALYQQFMAPSVKPPAPAAKDDEAQQD